jgi:hypothetical protein
MTERFTGQPNSEARTNRQFVAQLAAWDFAQRKEDGPHLVFRGPHGGTLRVVRSLLGRAEADRVGKAAQLAGVTVARFWAGPHADGVQETAPEPALAAPAAPAAGSAEASLVRRSAARDRVTSLVLGVHAAVDRPLGFDQVVQELGGEITRDQVRTASAQLCREGDLDRIRSGVYQWSCGVRSRARSATAGTSAPAVLPAPRRSTPMPSAPASRSWAPQLFEQLFPDGVRMTAELLADFERWAELTEKLAQHAQAS